MKDIQTTHVFAHVQIFAFLPNIRSVQFLICLKQSYDLCYYNLGWTKKIKLLTFFNFSLAE